MQHAGQSSRKRFLRFFQIPKNVTFYVFWTGFQKNVKNVNEIWLVETELTSYVIPTVEAIVSDSDSEWFINDIMF